MNPGFFTSLVATFVRVLGSTVVGEHGAVLLGGEGAVGDVDDPIDGGSSDKFSSSEAYCSPAIVWRPRPPEKVGDKTLGVEGIGLRLGERPVPVAVRDLRLNRQFKNPKPGSVALVGYGGGFLAFDDTDTDPKTSRATLYVPYAYSGGVPTKAMTLAIDPEAESMMLIHGDGYAVVLDKDNGITLRGGPSSWINVKDGTVDIVAGKVNIQGIVALGANPSLGVPITTPANPPSTSVLLAP